MDLVRSTSRYNKPLSNGDITVVYSNIARNKNPKYIFVMTVRINCGSGGHIYYIKHVLQMYGIADSHFRYFIIIPITKERNGDI